MIQVLKASQARVHKYRLLYGRHQRPISAYQNKIKEASYAMSTTTFMIPSSGLSKLCALLALVSIVSACNQPVKDDQAAGEAPAGVEQISGLHVVDCLLPGQVRRLGQGTYLTPRRPVRTTASDCGIRGGEYVAFDRADYKTALKVWLPTAEQGDAEAQTNVGEIFERGLGGEPNYKLAAFWYQKAADQGDSRAQFNLGTLYEQGHGVEKDQLIAMNWYRKAWGIEEDSVIFRSAADKAQEDLRKQLLAETEAKAKQIQLLNRQIAQLELDAKKAPLASPQTAELKQLVAWVSELESQRKASLDEMDLLPRFRQPEAQPALEVKTLGEAEKVAVADLDFGKYYALIIANQNYDQIDNLVTPHSDALRAKDILENQYGFNVTVVLDADSATVMQKINDFSSELKEEDNLLIFYAGHGSRIRSGEYEAGYWLPVDANPPPQDTFWVSNEFVTRHLARVKAKRVMVVSDSCYAGLLSSSPGYLFMGDQANYSMDYVRYKFPKRSRLLISSGGDFPVLDNADGGNSIFAKAFLDVLENGTGVITGPELYLKIRERVTERAQKLSFDQEPQLKVIKGAGHEVGDFFFIKQS